MRYFVTVNLWVEAMSENEAEEYVRGCLTVEPLSIDAEPENEDDHD